ncbi:MAG: ABC transporter ATP-binding protein [Bacteroidales bacterium]
MENIFSAKEVTKNYANHRALDKVSIDIPKHGIFGLLGPNGAGKTTLIRIINQITAPDSGHLTFDGEPLSQKHIARIGYLPEERGLYKKMKIGEQAIYLAELKGVKTSTAKKRLRYWFEKFEIQQWWNKKVEELSKGMAQKIQFITTIIHEPDLLIFDEPFSGFDPINVNLLKQEILNLRDKGTTIIFSTHNMGSVEELCDNIALINKSKKVLDGSVKKIKQDFKPNIYEIQLSDVKRDIIFDPKFEVLNTDPLDDHTFLYKIRLPKGGSPNELIANTINHSTVLGLKEILPSMDEIFIQTVENTKEFNC